MIKLMPEGQARANGTKSQAGCAQAEGTALEKTQSRSGRGGCVRDSGLYCPWTTLPLSEAGPMGRAMVPVYAGLTTQFNKQHHSVR